MLRRIGLGLLFIICAVEITAEPYPLDYWARRNAVSGVSLSPDGSKFALMRIVERGGNPIIEIYESDNLDKAPERIDADPMEFLPGVTWIDNDIFIFSARQQVREIIEGFNRGIYEYKNGIYDTSKRKLGQIRQDYFSVVGLLPDKPNKILVSTTEGVPDGMQAIANAIRPRAYWEYDIKKNRKKLLMRGKISLGNIRFDRYGNAITALGFDRGSDEFVYYWRPAGTKDWEEMNRIHEDSFESFRVAGIDPAADNHFFVIANNGFDKLGIWSYDAKNKKFSDLIYRRNDVDARGLLYHTNRLANTDDVTGISWCKDKCYREFFDASEEALYRQLEALIPNADWISIRGRSKDGNTLIVRNTGPRDPGTYYLIRNGKVSTISGRKPYLEYNQLAPVEYVEYEARDGKTIGGYVTMPKGEGPFPLVVMPHGGPFVGETVYYFDEWAQMLANNGYMVLQPQYRGSLKYGLEFYKSAFIDGSEAGHAMQDDKDDGALHLVKMGLVDRDQIAMFGWSYGGYAALIAASREDQIYQCAIAGAAVSDMRMQLNYYRYQLRGSQKIAQLSYRDGAVNPIDVAHKVNIPLLIVHGDSDQRVPPEHFDKYIDELDRAGISYKKLILEGADHFSDTLFYHHKISLYENMLDFLNNDCGLKKEKTTLASAGKAR